MNNLTPISLKFIEDIYYLYDCYFEKLLIRLKKIDQTSALFLLTSIESCLLLVRSYILCNTISGEKIENSLF